MAPTRRRKISVHDQLHPLIYCAMVGLTVWLVLSIWMFFDYGAYVSLTLMVITVFFVIIVGMPVLIWVTWRRNTPQKGHAESLRAWLSEEFSTWTGPITGMEAAGQILLPLAAVSIGMTIFGLVFYLDIPHAGY
jgi:uncharacterized protein YhhL (DUF1145 family)